MEIPPPIASAENAWTLDDLKILGGLTLVMAALVGLTLRALLRLSSAADPQKGVPRPGLGALHRDQDGTIGFEFLLLSPILLALGLLLTQTSLLMGAISVAQHAAVRSARTAAVQLPRYRDDYANLPGGPDGASQYGEPSIFASLPLATPAGPVPAGEAYERTRIAAVHALTPISGFVDQGQGGAYAEALGQVYERLGKDAPWWTRGSSGSVIAKRLQYANAYTHVNLSEPKGFDPGMDGSDDDNRGFFGWRDLHRYHFGDPADQVTDGYPDQSVEAVTVTIEFRYPLIVPYANLLGGGPPAPGVPDPEGPDLLLRAWDTVMLHRVSDKMPGTHRNIDGDQLPRAQQP
jgi:hypothetical protein